VLLFTHHVTLLLWAFLVLLVACFLAMRNAAPSQLHRQRDIRLIEQSLRT